MFIIIVYTYLFVHKLRSYSLLLLVKIDKNKTPVLFDEKKGAVHVFDREGVSFIFQRFIKNLYVNFNV